jgi:hypothetical protein
MVQTENGGVELAGCTKHARLKDTLDARITSGQIHHLIDLLGAYSQQIALK